VKTYTLDAFNKPLGRLASQIALILRGKNQPNFAPHRESQNVVVVKNVDGLKISGRKKEQKTYFSHSGFPSGAKLVSLKMLIEKRGLNEVLRRAVWGMLPANKLRARLIKNLKFDHGES
jgi:large subunit ribosomal protein L13